MQPSDLLLMALATFYLGYAVTKTEGPFKVFNFVRMWMPLGGLTTCFYCLIFWAGLAFFLLLHFGLSWAVYPFAAAGAAMFLFRWTGGGAVS